MAHAKFSIEKIRPAEIEGVTDLLTDAFEVNPAYSLIFNKKNNIRKGLHWLFRANLILLNRKQKLTQVVREKKSQKIIGTYTVIPPEGIKNSLWTYLQIGIPGFISEFGFHTFSKMMSMDDYNHKILNDAIQADQYHYLSMVVVKEEYRGAGVGSYAIRHCLNNLSRNNNGCPLIGLTTQLPENVTFYSKLGFEKIDEGEVIFKKDRYYNYNMKYNIKL